MTRGHATRTRIVGLRLSVDEAKVLQREAADCDLTLSELVRRRTFGQQVVSRTDQQAAASIDQLGRMLKHLYPKHQGWASAEDRKRWWALVTELERTAKALAP